MQSVEYQMPNFWQNEMHQSTLLHVNKHYKCHTYNLFSFFVLGHYIQRNFYHFWPILLRMFGRAILCCLWSNGLMVSASASSWFTNSFLYFNKFTGFSPSSRVRQNNIYEFACATSNDYTNIRFHHLTVLRLKIL